MKIKIYQSLQDTAKEVLKGKFITVNAYVKKRRSHKPTFPLKTLKKEEQTKPKTNRK